jgi:hypothetical protein
MIFGTPPSSRRDGDVSEPVDPTPDLQARIGEIHQQAHRKASRPEIIQALSVVVRIQGSDRLDLDQHGIFDQEVGDVGADVDTVIFHMDGDLLPDHQAGFGQFVRQSAFVDLFKQSGAECIGDSESAPDDPPGDIIETCSIGVLPRSSAVVFAGDVSVEG